MLKEKEKEKTIATVTKDNITMQFIPNYSVGDFIFKTPIDLYLEKPHSVETFKEKYYNYDSYYFYEDDVTVDVENGLVCNIICDNNFYWNNYNLIRMNFEFFLLEFNLKYDYFEKIYLAGIKQTQKVYDFDELGLQVWVWRNLIRTVIVSKYEEDE